MRCVKLGIVATKCLAERLEGGRIYLGCGFGSLVHHGGRKEKGEKREEGWGGRREGREEKERGAEERRQRDQSAAFPLFPLTPPRVPACNKGLAPLLSPRWNHVHRHIPNALSPWHWGYKGVCHHTWLFTWALRMKLRPSQYVLKCTCRYMPQHACGSQRVGFLLSPWRFGVFIAESLVSAVLCAPD